jgi:uncharacterized membrane protein
MSSFRPNSSDPIMEQVVARNIAALLARRHTQEQTMPRQDRLADAITRFTGSMRFVYLHLAVFGFWILINIGWLPLPRFDPSFVMLAMVASVEAIFLSTFVLISQNRMAAMSDKRAELDLHVSLLAEHEVTRLLTLVSAIADHLGIDAARDPEIAELSHDIAPETVLDQIEAHEQRATHQSAPSR